MKTRLLAVTPFNQNISGPNENLYALIPHFKELGIETYLALPAGGKASERFKESGAIVKELEIDRIRRSFSPFFWLSYLSKLINSRKKLVKLCQEEKINIIFNNMESSLVALLAAKELNIPSLTSFNGCLSTSPQFLLRPLIGYIYRLSDKAIAPSRYIADYFEELKIKGNFKIVINPIDTKRFKPREKKTKNSSFTIGFAGRYHPAKNIGLIIKALKIIKEQTGREIQLKIVGEAIIKEEKKELLQLKKLVISCGLKNCVEFLAAKEDISNFLRSIDLFILPSRKESFGRVLFEALSSGTISLASEKVSSLKLLPKEIETFSFKDDDPQHLSKKILAIMENYQYFKQLTLDLITTEARNLSDPSKIAATLKAIFGNLLEMKKNDKNQ